jgi:hypothetical protein
VDQQALFTDRLGHGLFGERMGSGHGIETSTRRARGAWGGV